MSSKCTHDLYYKLCEVSGNGIYLGSRSEAEDFLIHGYRPWLVIDATGFTVSSAKETKVTFDGDLDESIKNLLELAKLKINRLMIDWTDNGIPTLSKEFWKGLCDYIKKAPNRGPVFIHCVGGHGRTGTIAAILASLFEICGTEPPITYVRRVYCEAAVESKNQVWYVQTITGVDCPEEESNTYVQPVSTQWNNNSYSTDSWKDKTLKANDLYDKGVETIVGLGNKKKDTKSESTNGIHDNAQALMSITTEMWDDLSYDGPSNGYLDRNGVCIGNTLAEAVSVLKARLKLKEEMKP